MPVNSRLKATKIISQREAIYRQIIPESICAKEETVNIGIFETSRNGDRKIIQSIRITRRPPSRIRKWNQLVQMNIYQSNTYRKDLSWLHFDDEPKGGRDRQAASEGPTVVLMRFCSLSNNSE